MSTWKKDRSDKFIVIARSSVELEKGCLNLQCFPLTHKLFFVCALSWFLPILLFFFCFHRIVPPQLSDPLNSFKSSLDAEEKLLQSLKKKEKVHQTHQETTCRWGFRTRDQEWLRASDRNVIECTCKLYGASSTSYRNQSLWLSCCRAASATHFPVKEKLKILIQFA